MVGNKSGKRISKCAPAIGQCEQHHAAIRGKSATIALGVVNRVVADADLAEATMLVGTGKARELYYTAEPFDATQALS
jgi:hypothetical protein